MLYLKTPHPLPVTLSHEGLNFVEPKNVIRHPITPLKFNVAPEKWWLEDNFPIGKVTFQGLC